MKFLYIHLCLSSVYFVEFKLVIPAWFTDFKNVFHNIGNNPKTAVWEYLKTHPEFEIDKTIQHKLLITVAPDGYLKKQSKRVF
jgi:cephalosporin hydroxylase